LNCAFSCKLVAAKAKIQTAIQVKHFHATVSHSFAAQNSAHSEKKLNTSLRPAGLAQNRLHSMAAHTLIISK